MAEHSNPPVTIRVAAAEDVHLIHAGLLIIARHLDAEGKVTATPEDLRKAWFRAKACLHRSAGGIRWRICRHVSVFSKLFHSGAACTGAYIQDIAVEERFRGTGVGVALLRHTAAHVPHRGGPLSAPVGRSEECLGAAFL